MIAAVVLAPAVTWAVAQFVLLPRLQKSLTAGDESKPAAVAAEKPAAKGEKPAAKGEKKGADTGPAYRFQGYFEHLELEYMTKAGLTPMQALVSATSTAARS